MTSKAAAKRAAETKRKNQQARRKRRLTIVGALIVFATFTVREVFREQLKGLSDSIAAAENLETAAQLQENLSPRRCRKR
jgi:hypothetical protein